MRQQIEDYAKLEHSTVFVGYFYERHKKLVQEK